MKAIVYSSLLLFSLSLFSYSPGKWSHTDSILLFPKKIKDLPIQELVYDENNSLILTSNLKYNDGFLVSEEFINNGKKEGSISYQYDKNGKLSKEVTLDSSGKMIEIKEFVFNGKGSLSKIKTFDVDKKLIQDATIYSMDSDMISTADILWTESKDKEKYSLSTKPNLKILTIMDEKKKPIAKIENKINAKGNIIERLFTQGNIERKNILEYDNSDRLVQFTFHVKQDGIWKHVKTHKLSY